MYYVVSICSCSKNSLVHLYDVVYINVASNMYGVVYNLVTKQLLVHATYDVVYRHAAKYFTYYLYDIYIQSCIKYSLVYDMYDAVYTHV